MRIYIIVTVVLALCVVGCSRQSAKDRARKLTGKGTEIVEGVGEQLKETGNKAGKAIGEGAGAFFTGVGEGVEKSVSTRDVRVAEDLKAKGVSVTITKHAAGSATNQWQHGLSLYVLNKEPVAGVLRVRLFNEGGQEIGRSTNTVTFAADDARYVEFLLHREVPVLMTKYIELDLKRD